MGAQCEAAFNTNLIVSALSKQRQHTRLEPHGAECVQSTDHDTQDGRRGGGRRKEERKEWMTNKKELKSKREDRRGKRKGFQWKSRFERRQERMKARYKRQLVGRNEEIKDVRSEDRQTDRRTGQVSVLCCDADTL